jgi:peroxiredoxin (alkyl hydroperoxide reductase subunit C)
MLGAVEHFCIQFFFQLLNHHAKGGLRDAASVCRFGKVAEVIDRDYIFQLLYIHTKIDFVYAKINIISLTRARIQTIFVGKITNTIIHFKTEKIMQPIINSQLPEFNLQAYQNGNFKTVSNDDVKGKWAIFFFYPADFTFVCPTELADMADKYAVFQDMGIEVYSVSADTHFVHKAWHDTSETIRKIKYPMLADPTGTLSRALGVWIEEVGLTYRGTFLVNPEGQIKIAEIHDNGIGRNAEELLRKAEAAQFVAAHPNEVCPAKWKKGDATLKPSIDLVGKI